MDDKRLPERLLNAELTVSQRSLGRLRKRYKDSLEESLKRCDIPYSTWEASAEDRPAWRSLVRVGILVFEDNCIRENDQIRQRKKERCSNPQPGPASPARIATNTSARRLGLQPSPHPLYPPVIQSHGLLRQRRTNIKPDVQEGTQKFPSKRACLTLLAGGTLARQWILNAC